MTLRYALLTQTDTAAPALAYLTQALVTPLSAGRVFRRAEELKLGGPLKTIVLLVQLLMHRGKTCCRAPNFHRR